MGTEHKPRLMIILRHGRSEANLDWNVNCTIPNHAVRLTKEGVQQATEAGYTIKDLIRPGEKVMVYQSPYTRARETAQGIVDVLEEHGAQSEIAILEDPRLREQDFGNFQDPVQMKSFLQERRKYGMFFYRIPNGESPADVFDRCSSFCDTLHRHFDRSHPDVVILVSHGIWGRVFLMRWFHWPFEKFENLKNLGNATPVVLERQSAEDGYVLLTQLHDRDSDDEGSPQSNGHPV